MAVEAQGLRKVYRTTRGPRIAVDGLDLAVPRGGVHGFLGPNGSGKTTTLRMLLGLARPTGGTMALLGQRVPDRLPQVVHRVGAVVESPKFSPGLTGRQNLLLLARAVGVADSRVDAAVETVGLTERARDRYRGYSLGMRQRLAIAATLLRDPDLLVLDEPTNGLDPAGIRSVRDTVRDLGERGVTVLVSSHVLAEVQQVCTGVTILDRGRVVATGPVAELLSEAAGGRHEVLVDDPEAALRLLLPAGYAARAADPPGTVVVDGVADPAALTRTLGEGGVWLRGLRREQVDLESVFLGLTGGSPAPLARPGTGGSAGRTTTEEQR
nr:ABC transporter ATP-binding protein [Nocardioides perillae]